VLWTRWSRGCQSQPCLRACNSEGSVSTA
jgi:hypothetical protein